MHGHQLTFNLCGREHPPHSISSLYLDAIASYIEVVFYLISKSNCSLMWIATRKSYPSQGMANSSSSVTENVDRSERWAGMARVQELGFQP